MSLELPYTLVAELTYRCPLRCGYCSNPIGHAARGDALDAAAWRRVFVQAAELGVLSVHLTGGEPLVRRDLEAVVDAARSCALFTTIVTSGVPLSRERLARLRDAGLDAIQLSLQHVDARLADDLAGGPWHDHKLEVARWARALGLSSTINVVLHRRNIDSLSELVDLAAEVRADRLELANVQLLGGALPNAAALLPTRAQIERARREAADARARLRGRMDIVFVVPDYHAGLPRACMDGWARRYVVVTPDGLALPCHAAHAIPGLESPSAKERSLRSIWLDTPLFRAFRGETWMSEPCRSCERRKIDFGGCRCQALALTGDPRATDPACAKSPAHELVASAREAAERGPLLPTETLRRGR